MARGPGSRAAAHDEDTRPGGRRSARWSDRRDDQRRARWSEGEPIGAGGRGRPRARRDGDVDGRVRRARRTDRLDEAVVEGNETKGGGEYDIDRHGIGHAGPGAIRRRAPTG